MQAKLKNHTRTYLVARELSGQSRQQRAVVVHATTIDACGMLDQKTSPCVSRTRKGVPVIYLRINL